MISALITMVGTKLLGALAGLVGMAAGGAVLFFRGKSAGERKGAETAKAQLAQAIEENHAVEQQQAAATTDPEADHALDAAADTDHS